MVQISVTAWHLINWLKGETTPVQSPIKQETTPVQSPIEQ